VRARGPAGSVALGLSGGIAPLVWWQAATCRWRTTHPLQGTPDQTRLPQSRRKTKRRELAFQHPVLRPLVTEGTTREASAHGDASLQLQLQPRSPGRRSAWRPGFLVPTEIVGLRPRFPPDQPLRQAVSVV